MSKLSLFLLTLVSTLVQSQVDPSCPRWDPPFCSQDQEANFEDIPAATGLLLTAPSVCLESYGKLEYEGFSVFSMPLNGFGWTHLAGFQLNVGTHQINKGDGMEIFFPRGFDFLCGLPTLALGLAATVDCTIRVAPLGTNQEGRSVQCSYTAAAGGLLSDLTPGTLVPARCQIPDWGWTVEALTIEIVQPAVLNTLYAFGLSNFHYADSCYKPSG